MTQNKSMAAFAIFVMLCLFLFTYSMSAAPVFSLLCLVCLVSLFLFINLEDSFMHASSEAENRFWTLFTASLASAALFAYDSPVCIGQHYPVVGALSVVGLVLWVHNNDRAQVRRELGRPSGLVRSASVDLFDQVNIEVAKGLAQELAECVQVLDFRIVPAKLVYRSLIEDQYVPCATTQRS